MYVKNGLTPLLLATSRGYEQIVQILLEKGKANIEIVDQVFIIFEKIEKILIKHEAKLSLQDNNVLIFFLKNCLFFLVSWCSLIM